METASPIIINGHGTGLIPDPPDKRDYLYTERLARLDTSIIREEGGIPDYRDLRRRFEGVYDQGRLGSCTAQAVAGAIEYLQWLGNYETIITPSRLQLYYDARAISNPAWITQDSGAYLRAAAKAAADRGVAPEGLWRYDISRFTSEPPFEVYAAAELRQTLEYFRITDGSIMEMLRCLAAGFPFAFGVSVYENFWPKRGVIPIPAGAELGGHAMLAVGYSRRSRRILARNSWGANWGIKGYAWLPYEYMESAWDLWTLRSMEKPEA